MNKEKVLIIGHCEGESLKVATGMIGCCGDRKNSLPTIEEKLKELGYSDEVIRSILNTESMSQAKQSFEDLAKTLKSVNLPVLDEPKSKYINNPIRNYKR